jgi:alkanesulfonate monooxygenase SsuD/methylene tetrahydromethanopterin reductase-like flavin-dependent oxidoreductase (luciferase family)
MGSPLKYGLGVNANETLQSIVEKSRISEMYGLDYLWVSDLPEQLYAAVVASKVASRTKRIRIGLGLMSILLHAPRQIAMAVEALLNRYGDRFDLCIGAGDVHQLKRVGVHDDAMRDLPSRVLEARRKIESHLHKRRIKTQIWLGAQGPKMLETAKNYDGVLLNYSKPSMIRWAIARAQLTRKNKTSIGIYSPSYVHVRPQADIMLLAKMSSSVVALGAPRTVLQRFGLYERLSRAREILEAGSTVDSVLDSVPDEVVEDFSVTMRTTNLPAYLAALKHLGVSHVVFAYPQNYSVDTVRELREGLDLASQASH